MHHILFMVTEITPVIADLMRAHKVKIQRVSIIGEELHINTVVKTQEQHTNFLNAVRCADGFVWASPHG